MSNENSYVTIRWGDSTEDNLYLNLSKLDSENLILVSSDDNSSGSIRTITLTFAGTNNTGEASGSKVNLFITQQADNSLIAKLYNP